MTVGAVRLQFGALNQTVAVLARRSPRRRGLSGDPITVPGGLLGLMCPSDIPVISDICDAVVGSPLNKVTATLEPAGPADATSTCPPARGDRPPDHDAAGEDPPDATRSWTANCYIGSNSDPMLLKVANQTRPTARFVRFNAAGAANPAGEMSYTDLSGASVADSTFAVPAAPRLRPVRA